MYKVLCNLISFPPPIFKSLFSSLKCPSSSPFPHLICFPTVSIIFFHVFFSSPQPWYSLTLFTAWYTSPTDLINFIQPAKFWWGRLSSLKEGKGFVKAVWMKINVENCEEFHVGKIRIKKVGWGSVTSCRQLYSVQCTSLLLQKIMKIDNTSVYPRRAAAARPTLIN